MKPVQLLAYPIRNSSMANGIVLDPFLGSGSTMIACEQTDRICRDIELDPKYVDVIVKRYFEHKDEKSKMCMWCVMVRSSHLKRLRQMPNRANPDEGQRLPAGFVCFLQF